MQGKISMELSFCQAETGFSLDELVENERFADESDRLYDLFLRECQRDPADLDMAAQKREGGQRRWRRMRRKR